MIIISNAEKRNEMLKLAKKKRNDEQYEKTKTNPITCDVCQCQITSYYYEKHCLTKRHLKALESKNDNPNRLTCDVCHCEMDTKYFKKHCLTKRHIKWSELLAREKKA